MRAQVQLDALTDPHGALSPQAYLSWRIVVDADIVQGRDSPELIDLRREARVRLARAGVWILDTPVSILPKAGELGLFEVTRARRLVGGRVAETGCLTLTDRRVVYHAPEIALECALDRLAGGDLEQLDVLSLRGVGAPEPLLIQLGADALLTLGLIAVAREQLGRAKRVVRSRDLPRLAGTAATPG